MALQITNSTFTDNHANEGGGAIFFVSNDRTGTLSIRGSRLTDNVNDGFQTQGLPGIFFLGAHPTVDRRLETPLTNAAAAAVSADAATVIALGDRDERFLTHRELDATLDLIGDGINCRWVATDSPAARALDDVDGVWLVPGSPYRDDGAAYHAIDHCLRTGTPYLGTCAGFQYACVQLARTLAGRDDAAHAESDPEAPDPVVGRAGLLAVRRATDRDPGAGNAVGGDLRRAAVRGLSLVRLRPRSRRSADARRRRGHARGPRAGRRRRGDRTA